jgi:hypothetical protein
MQSRGGNWVFFEDNNDMIYYSLVSRVGKSLRKGQIAISKDAFTDYLVESGFEHANAADFARARR